MQLESTQYKRWFSKSWGGKDEGSVAGACDCSLDLGPFCASSLPTSSRPGLRRRPAQGNHQETEALALRGDGRQDPWSSRQWSAPGARTAPLPAPSRKAGPHPGDSIGPLNTIRHQCLPAHTVEPGLLNLGLEPPVRPSQYMNLEERNPTELLGQEHDWGSLATRTQWPSGSCLVGTGS